MAQIICLFDDIFIKTMLWVLIRIALMIIVTNNISFYGKISEIIVLLSSNTLSVFLGESEVILVGKKQNWSFLIR